MVAFWFGGRSTRYDALNSNNVDVGAKSVLNSKLPRGRAAHWTSILDGFMEDVIFSQLSIEDFRRAQILSISEMLRAINCLAVQLHSI